MFKQAYVKQMVSFTSDANALIFHLQKIPLIKKMIPDTLYKKTDIKTVFGVVALILSLFWGLIKTALYFVFFFLLALNFWDVFGFVLLSQSDYFGYVFICLNMIGGSLLNSVFASPNSADFLALRMMRMEPRPYYLNAMIRRNIKNTVYYLPAFLLLSDMGWGKSVIVLAELALCRWIGEAVFVAFYDRFGKHSFFFSDWMRIIMGLVLLSVTYLLPMAAGRIPGWQSGLFHPLLVTGLAVSGIISVYYLAHYRKFTILMRDFVTAEILIDESDIDKKLMVADVEVEEKKIKKKELYSSRYERKSGYEYLNALFFARHRRTFRLMMILRYGVCIVLTVLLSAVVVAGPGYLKENVWEILPGLAPLMIFIMYMASLGQRISKAMFFNCDISLLHYGVYREPKAILVNFYIRVRKVVWMEIKPLLILTAGLLLLPFLTSHGAEWYTILPVTVTILGASCFFDVFYLALYYLCQPYTQEYEMKGILYRSVSALMYVFSFSFMQIKMTSVMFTVAILAVTLIGILAAIVLVYFLAPKTFKLRR